MGLFVLGALRGLCGFCVREWLGGLKACSVFRLSFSSLVLLSCFRLLSCLASCLVRFLGFVAWLLVLVGLLAFFPFRMYRQKERAQRFCSLRPLFVCCVLVMQNRAFRSRKIRNR